MAEHSAISCATIYGDFAAGNKPLDFKVVFT